MYKHTYTCVCVYIYIYIYYTYGSVALLCVAISEYACRNGLHTMMCRSLVIVPKLISSHSIVVE